jgi:hypothetical protein
VVNLLISDVLKLEVYSNVLKESQKVIKYVRNHDFVNSKFEEIRKVLNVAHKLTLPVPTRWYSNYNSIKSLLDSKYALFKLLDMYKTQLIEINPKETSKEVIKIIERKVFWEKLTKLASIIEYPTNIIGMQHIIF